MKIVLVLHFNDVDRERGFGAMQGDGVVRLVEYWQGCVVAKFSKGLVGRFKKEIAKTCSFGLDRSMRGTRVKVKSK